MDEQKQIRKTKEEAEPQAMEEASDDSLEKVNGGVQPKPRKGEYECQISDTTHL